MSASPSFRHGPGAVLILVSIQGLAEFLYMCMFGGISYSVLVSHKIHSLGYTLLRAHSASVSVRRLLRAPVVTHRQQIINQDKLKNQGGFGSGYSFD